MKIQTGLLAFVFAIALAAPVAAQDAGGDAKAGKTLFLANGCYSCHGTVGQGSPRTGPTLGHMELPFSVFASRLRTPVNEMPPYTAKVLTYAQVGDIYAYLKSIPAAPDYKTIKLLQ